MQKGVFGRFCLARIDYNQLHPVLHGLLHGLTRVDREALLGDYRISADHDPGFRTGECIWSCHPATVKRLRDHLACLIDRLDGEESVWIRAHRHDEHGSHDRVKWIAQISIAGIDRDRRSEEHTSELQSLMRTSYAVFCLK